MVTLYFGLPGCGKTTIATAIAKKCLKKHKHVYVNFPCNLPGVEVIPNEYIGRYALEDCALIVDEATLFADSRDYKTFDAGKKHYFLYHRHYRANIYLFTQMWNAVDIKIRTITDKVYYVYKGAFLGRWFTKYYRIPYGIIIPDPKRDGGSSKLGEIVQGYCKPPLLVRLFGTTWVFRPSYYRYFDTFEIPNKLPKVP